MLQALRQINAVPAAPVVGVVRGERVAGDGVVAASAGATRLGFGVNVGRASRGGARYSRGLSTVAANASTREEVEGKTATVGGTGIDNNGNGRWRSSRDVGRWDDGIGRHGGGGGGVNDRQPGHAAMLCRRRACESSPPPLQYPIHVPWCVSTRVAHISHLLLRALRLF